MYVIELMLITILNGMEWNRLNRLQCLSGVIPNIKAIGTEAKMVLSKYMHCRVENEYSRQHTNKGANNTAFQDEPHHSRVHGKDHNFDMQFMEAIDTLVM